MIEIERSFAWETEKDLEKLLSKAVFLGEKKNDDVYYDTPEFLLMWRDVWLRIRSARTLELKVGKNKDDKEHDTYTEYVFAFGDESGQLHEIMTIIGIAQFPRDTSLEGIREWLVASEFFPAIEVHTVRRSFEHEGLYIDVDDTNNGLHKEVEIEARIESESERNRALQRIQDCAKKLGLVPRGTAPGKAGIVLEQMGGPGLAAYQGRFRRETT